MLGKDQAGKEGSGEGRPLEDVAEGKEEGAQSSVTVDIELADANSGQLPHLEGAHL